jgi:hypothetical protein
MRHSGRFVNRASAIPYTSRCLDRVSALLVLSLGLGCTRSYTVRASHLARADAQRRDDVSIPAVDRSGTATFLTVGAIDYEDPPDPGTGMQHVEVMDFTPALRIGGWVFTGFGLAMAAQLTDSPAGTDIRLPMGLVLTGAGVILLVLGYLVFDPEESGPSRGFPDDVRTP